MDALSWTLKQKRKFRRQFAMLVRANSRSRYAPLVYDPAGKGVLDALWDETMAELSFAGVKQVLESLKN